MCDTLIERETQQVALSFSDFGQSYSGLSGKNAEDFGDDYPFITYMNVYQNQIIDSTDVGLVKIKETEQQLVVRYGDILFTLSSETPEEVGMGAVYLGETYSMYLNSFCFGIHITDESKIYPPFLAYYVSSQLFRACLNFVQQHPYCSKFHHFLNRIEREFVVPAESSVIIEPRESPFHNPSLTYWFKAV